ncbi:MAG: hypothetical protein Q9162_006348 [Coniocarpon cinnabarinum]
MSYSSTPELPSSDAPPRPPPKTRTDLPQAVQQTATPPTPSYQPHPPQQQALYSHGPSSSQQYFTQDQTGPPRPPSHPAITYAESNPASPPQVYEARTSTPAELGSDDASSAAALYAAGRRQGSIDHELATNLPPTYQNATPQPSTHPSHPQQPRPQPPPPNQVQPSLDPTDTQQPPPMPPPNWLPDILTTKSKTDLEALLSDSHLLQSLLHHPAHTPAILQHSTQSLQNTLSQTSNLATQTSKTAHHLNTERTKVQAQLLRTRGLEQTFRTRQNAHEEAIERFGPRALNRRLGAATKEGEDDLKAVVESWLGLEGVSSEREVSEWLREVRKRREVLELRRERGLRWGEGRVGGWR